MLYYFASFLVGVLFGMLIQVYGNGIQYSKGVKDGFKQAFSINFGATMMARKLQKNDNITEVLKERNK